MLRQRLYEVLLYARDHTAFWGSRIPARFSPGDTWSVYEELPTSCADDLSEDLLRFESREFGPGSSYLTTTGGTGRRPTPIRLSNKSFGAEWAHIHHLWGQVGYVRRRDTKLTLRGKHLAGSRVVRFNPIYNEIVVDTFRLGRENFGEVVQAVSRWGARYVHGYPSLVREFAERCREAQWWPRFRGILLGSEGSSLQERAALREQFGCPVVAWYGQSEKVILAGDVNESGRYVVYTSYGFPDVVEGENGWGELIGTSFVNRALPLVKYRTGDFARVVAEGDALYLTDVVGRWGRDFIYLSRDKRVPSAAINLHSSIQEKLLFYQIRQSAYGRVTVFVLPKRECGMPDDELASSLARELGEKLRGCEIKVVVTHRESDMVRSARGKLMLIVQELEGLA